MNREVYITRLSKFFPNNPVQNEEMEDYIGMIDGKASRSRRIILRSNGIRQRYYALDKNGKLTHSNAELTANAIINLVDDKFKLEDIEMLMCGTTSPDQILPSHAVMVHGIIKSGILEIGSFASGCMAGIQALKNGFLSVASSNTNNAVCTASERISPWMLSRFFEKESEIINQFENDPYIAFEKDFVRWMLSDGAGALLLENKPGPYTSLRIEWIDIASYAHENETCMYAGATKDEKGDIHGWYEHSPDEWLEKSIFSLTQDIKLLKDNIVLFGSKFLKEVIKKRNFDIHSIDYFLPHLSSFFFKDKIYDELKSCGLEVPYEKWFTNLATVGNVGAASPYLMLEELLSSGKLKRGERILIMVPESARFSYGYALFTVC